MHRGIPGEPASGRRRRARGHGTAESVAGLASAIGDLVKEMRVEQQVS